MFYQNPTITSHITANSVGEIDEVISHTHRIKCSMRTGGQVSDVHFDDALAVAQLLTQS